MKMNKTLLSMSLALFATSALAQTGVASGTPFGSGQDSINCRRNLSLLGAHMKTGSFQDAIEPYTLALKECPGSSKNIYIHGARLLKWKLEKETDVEKKKAIAEELNQLYDVRAKYFGDDPKFGLDQITSAKIVDYLGALGNTADYEQIKSWTKARVDEAGAATAPQLLYYYAYSSRIIAQLGKATPEDYINDYLKAADLMDEQLTAAAGDEEAIKAIETFKTPLDAEFAASGLATCDILMKVYTTEKVEANKENKAYLSQVSGLFAQADCQSEAYFLASRYLFQIEPNARAAMGLAGRAIQQKNYSEANDYLQRAIQLTDKNSEKVLCYEMLANLASIQGNHAAVRNYTNSALAINPKSGRSLIRLATAIGAAAGSIFPNDPVKQRCVYYLVIDKLQAAAAADPSVSAEANRQIGRYRSLLPSAESIFMHPELKQGASFTVPGYGTTTIR